MTRRRTAPRSLDVTTTLDRDPEIEVYIRYTGTPGEPASGPTYDCGGDPGYGSEVEIDSVTLHGSTESVELTPDEDARIRQFLREHFDDEPLCSEES